MKPAHFKANSRRDIVARDLPLVQLRLSQVMRTVICWMTGHGHIDMLMNASYKSLVKQDMPVGTFLIDYAVDIAAVIVPWDLPLAQLRFNQLMRRIIYWMTAHRLRLAEEKTEIGLLIKKCIPIISAMRIGKEIVEAKKAVKYLGMSLGNKLTFSP